MRKEAIETLKENLCAMCAYGSQNMESCDIRYCDNREAISILEQESKWTLVSEELPKPYEQVLRTIKSIGWNSTFHIHVDVGTICPADKEVIAWMPLPESYKRESEGKE